MLGILTLREQVRDQVRLRFKTFQSDAIGRGRSVDGPERQIVPG